MSTNNPMDAIERWLQDGNWSMASALAIPLGIKSNSDDEAVELFRQWIHAPRNPHEALAAALLLRAIIDFDCWRFSSPGYQDWIDANFQYAADAGSLSVKQRVAINEILGRRRQAKPEGLTSAETWNAARPTEQSIFEWWFDQTLSPPPSS